MKIIYFSRHANDQMADRGATQADIIKAIRNGEQCQAKKGRLSFRKNFPFSKMWKGKRYETKQVVPIIAEEEDRFIVVTVFVYYFGGKDEDKI